MGYYRTATNRDWDSMDISSCLVDDKTKTQLDRLHK